MTLLLAAAGAVLGVWLVASGAFELAWGLWELLAAPFRRDG